MDKCILINNGQTIIKNIKNIKLYVKNVEKFKKSENSKFKIIKKTI